MRRGRGRSGLSGVEMAGQAIAGGAHLEICRKVDVEGEGGRPGERSAVCAVVLWCVLFLPGGCKSVSGMCMNQELL
jgi:hypothetical protein